ncbi:uncharacterized protein LOC142620132 [Castanea sativa]|uniref:uncharacterized protein LOC142620132 n=1 Tax=Castanea sativa TaxID=21020 RepID=UPI003F64BD10
MPGIDTDIVQHHIPTDPTIKLVKQKLRRMKPEWTLKIKEEVEKQYNAGFLQVVNYPEWLANVVPVPKKDGKGMHSYPSWMVSLDTIKSRWHQKLWRRLRSSPLGEHTATKVEVYVDDVIVKSKNRGDHMLALRKFFERIKHYKLQLNPKKCTFGVTSGKLLGFMVSNRGMDVDPEKVKAITEMKSPKTKKEIRGFLGRIQYISRIYSSIDYYLRAHFQIAQEGCTH